MNTYPPVPLAAIVATVDDESIAISTEKINISSNKTKKRRKQPNAFSAKKVSFGNEKGTLLFKQQIRSILHLVE
jgi:hypothetical protein